MQRLSLNLVCWCSSMSHVCVNRYLSQVCNKPMSAVHSESGWHTTALPALAMPVILSLWRSQPSISHHTSKNDSSPWNVANTCSVCVGVRMPLLCLLLATPPSMLTCAIRPYRTYISIWGGVCEFEREKYDFNAAWFYLFVEVMIELLNQQHPHGHAVYVDW